MSNTCGVIQRVGVYRGLIRKKYICSVYWQITDNREVVQHTGPPELSLFHRLGKVEMISMQPGRCSTKGDMLG